MTTFKPLNDLKIESLVATLRYPVRLDFKEKSQSLVDSVCRTLNSKLRESGLPGVVDADLDDDGDLIFQYESSNFHFKLVCSQDGSGLKFLDLKKHSLARIISQVFFDTVIKELELNILDGFSVKFKNIFDIDASQNEKNYAIFERNFFNRMGEVLVPIFGGEESSNQQEIVRADFKLAWRYDDDYSCAYSIECPANAENSTIWTELVILSRTDIEVQKEHINFAKCFRIYEENYTRQLSRLFANTELNFKKRDLEIAND